jgi:hypothetical protein
VGSVVWDSTVMVRRHRGTLATTAPTAEQNKTT